MDAGFGSTLAICLVIIALTGATFYMFVNRRKKNIRSYEEIQTIVMEEIKDVRELITVRKNFTSVISFNDDKKIPFLDVHMPGSSRKFLMDYSGTITCGCDLDKISFECFGNSVKIIVPPSRILDKYADVNSFKIHHQSTGLLAKDIKIEDQNELIKADLEQHKQKALQEGILVRASENVRQMLEMIISKRGLNKNFNVEIVLLNPTGTKTLTAPHND